MRKGIMSSEELASGIKLALIYDVDDEGDTDGVVETVFDGVVNALKPDVPFPRLTRADYELLFADVAEEARETLPPYWKINTELAAVALAEAVIDEVNEEGVPHECRKNPEADQAAVVEQRR
jgi:hypothetical protein